MNNKLVVADNEKYMRRCLQLALNGRGFVYPNPLVGAVVVYDRKIIGEGFHRSYGHAHAEVNAINSVKDKSLLKSSTLYVSLEPCSHYGKTPPCSRLIIELGIPRVVVAMSDPYDKVSGRGLRMLQEAGVDVCLGVLEEEAKTLNREFITYHTKKRPYIYLKWAQTKDGFLDRLRVKDMPKNPTPISNLLTKLLVHKLRSEVAAIMIATNTAVNDNPSLTTRFWYGKNPKRIVLDRSLRVPKDHKLFNDEVETLVFTECVAEIKSEGQTTFIPIMFDEKLIPNLLHELTNHKIISIMVEGGRQLLQSFIDVGLWDEAYVEIADSLFTEGVEAPRIKGVICGHKQIACSYSTHLKNAESNNLL